MNTIYNYFNLKNQFSTKLMSSDLNETSKDYGFLQWLSLYLGVFIQPFFEGYQETGSLIWKQNGPFWQWIIFSVIVSLIVFPAVYKSIFNKDQPVFIQMISIFISGLGWETLVNTALS